MIFILFIIAIIFTLVGIVLTLLVEWHYLNTFLLGQPEQKESERLESCLPRYQLPKELKETVENNDSQSQRDASVALNLFFQFLYKELKDTKKVRRWFMKKLSIEFEELLQKTTTGKLIDQITLRDLVLGTEFPVIKDFSVSNIQLHESKDYIQELDIVMNVEYSGGFQLSVSADLVWGRSAYLAVQITHLNGKVRLQLTRQPFTHWSITFCQEPVMDFKVESQFQGRPVPQITSLIISQIRRAIKKKHTLPNYKVRFKPFFEKPESAIPEVDVNSGRLTEGRLEVSVIECSRLVKIHADPKYYCTLAIDALAWTEHSIDNSSMWITLDFEITKLPFQNSGLLYKQELVTEKGKQCIVIENIVPESPSSHVDLRKGDILLMINGVRITSASQTNKLLKQTNNKYAIRIERRSLLNASRSHETLSKMDEHVLSLKDVEPNMSAEVVEDFLNFKMKNDEGDNSPSNSRTPVHGSPMKKILLSAQSGIFSKQKGSDSLEVAIDQRRKSEGNEQLLKSIHQAAEKSANLSQSNAYEDHLGKNVNLRKTKAVPGNPDPIWEEKFVFEVEDTHKYLNVGVWCKKPDRTDKTTKLEKDSRGFRYSKDILVGQVSISLLDVSMECAVNSQGFHQQIFHFKPPELKPTASRFYKLATHPGFDENLCYGDVTLVFIHKPQPMSVKVDKRPSDTSSIASESDDENGSNSGDKERESLEVLTHDFNGTQFKTTTSCHFCGKKIWLKVAFQCRNCGMICHKKCVVKCQTLTACTADGAKLLPQTTNHSGSGQHPQIITTDAIDDQPPETSDSSRSNDSSTVVDPSSTPLNSPKTPRRSIPSLLANLASSAAQAKSGLIRVGSAHNLAPPSQHYTTQSKSLPPSPQYSPLSSRKTSLQGNPFHVTEDSELLEDVSLTVQRLLQHPNDEILVSAAKEMGKELFAGLELQERKGKLNAMIKKVQIEIDNETESRSELAKRDRQSTDPVFKTRLAFQLAKSDERSRALAVLLLHYYAGIQHCQEEEERLTAAEKSDISERMKADEICHSTEESCPRIDIPIVNNSTLIASGVSATSDGDLPL